MSEEKVKWEKQRKRGINNILEPLLNNLLLLLEMEKKQAQDKLEQVTKFVEKTKEYKEGR